MVLGIPFFYRWHKRPRAQAYIPGRTGGLLCNGGPYSGRFFGIGGDQRILPVLIRVGSHFTELVEVRPAGNNRDFVLGGL